ncbi:alpha/beta hydrolase [Cetobacterium sp. 8H]|uniref:alpha/beta hydrolase n=1 Tax=Cetobacterium sp. 8H TaxID=2759681 RepID=UPI001C8EA048|nr:alpha/beta hydrolase [Cetobacterium sp. 8H]
MKYNFFLTAGIICAILNGCSSIEKTDSKPNGYYAKNGCFIETNSKPMIASRSPLDISYIKTKYLDIPYETVPNSQKLDIYLPNEGNGPFPVIIGVHGGGFKYGKKDGAMNQSMVDGVKKGYAVVMINYRLSDEAKFPAAIEDLKASIRYVKANAKKYNLNPNKIALWGASSGGNLVSLAGTTGDRKIFNNPKLGNSGISTEVQAVVDWFGPIDFLTMDNQFIEEGIKGQNHNSADSFESQYLGAQITKVPNLVKETNPETYISKDTPPFLIEHGTADVLIPYTQSINFANSLEKVIGKENVELVLLKCAGHGQASAFDSEDNLKIVFDFLDKHLK